MIEVAISSVEAVFDWKAFQEKENRKKNKNTKSKKTEEVKAKKVAAEKEEVAATEFAATAEKVEEPKAEAIEKPMEIDIAQLFDIKLTNEPKEIKSKKAPKKDPMPSATKAVAASVSKDEDDDDILKALDIYFEYKGSKSVMEISDEASDEDAVE